MKSLKHSRIFAYKRHNKVFADKYADNRRDMLNFKAGLGAKGEHVEVRRLKQFSVRASKQKLNDAYSLTWYTRKDRGAKANAVPTRG